MKTLTHGTPAGEPAMRQIRQQIRRQRPARARRLPPLDLRTPSGKPLPF
jgi:hypothetical protein